MKKNTTRKVIHIVKHKQTGAEVPVIIDKVNDDNIIEHFTEHTEKRKYFTISMLCERWNKTSNDVMVILKKYEIPAFLNHKELNKIQSASQLENKNQFPIHAALFFEEYIYALEKKEKLNHNKFKSRLYKKDS